MRYSKSYYERYWKKQKGESIKNPPLVSDPKKFVLFLKPFLYGKVLDVGCGKGSITEEMTKVAGVIEVAGIDIVQHILPKKSKAKYKVGDAVNIPFKDKEFDCVVATDVIEHILDTEKIFAEFNRVLKNDGVLVISTPEIGLLKRLYILLLGWGFFFHPASPHIRFYSKESIKQILNDFKFKPIHYESTIKFLGISQGMLIVAKKDE